ncbi:MAG: hypothetical protein Q9217_001318 [Psora testacea]
MEPPYKRQRLPGYENTDVDLQRRRAQNDRRLKSLFESIFEKYEKNFEGIGDEIDLETGEIVVNNGHILAMRHEKDAGDMDETCLSDVRDDSSSVNSFSGSVTNSLNDGESVFSVAEVVETSSVGGLTSENEFQVEVKHSPVIGSDAAAVPGTAPGDIRQDKTNDEYEDELGDDSPHTSSPTCRSVPRHDHWRLPDRRVSFKAEEAADPKWSAPPLPSDTLRHRPFHRRIALPSPVKLEYTSGGPVKSGSSASIWAGKPRRQRCRQATNALNGHQLDGRGAHSDHRSTCTTWTSANERTLRYLKKYTQLTYEDIVKYFPSQTERSLAWYWNSVRDDNEGVQNQTLQSTRSDERLSSCESSIPSLTGCANGVSCHVDEYHETHYLVSSPVPVEAKFYGDQNQLQSQETLPNSRWPQLPKPSGPSNTHALSVRPVLEQIQENTSHLQALDASHPELICTEGVGLRKDCSRHVDDVGSEVTTHREFPKTDISLPALKEQHSLDASRTKEVPDSDSPAAPLSPLATVKAPAKTPTELSPPLNTLPDEHSVARVSEELQLVDVDADAPFSRSEETQGTLVDRSVDTTSMATGLHDQDLEVAVKARCISTEKSRSSQCTNDEVSSSFQQPTNHDEEPVEVRRTSAKPQSRARGQQVHVLIPLRKQKDGLEVVSSHKDSRVRTSAIVARGHTAAGGNASYPPSKDESPNRPSSKTDHGSTAGVRIATREISDSQPSHIVAQAQDGIEKVMHATPAIQAAGKSTDEEAMFAEGERGNPMDISLNDSQPASKIESVPLPMHPLSVSGLSVTDQRPHNPKAKAVNAPMAASVPAEEDDGSEDDLNLSHSTARPQKIFKPITRRPRSKATPFSALIHCSDDELAG